MKNNCETIKKLPTPCYIFDETECVKRAEKIKQEVNACGGKLCYAIKANPFLIPGLLPVVDKFEVCSPGELEICRKYGVPGEKILFSGVVKTKQDIKEAVAYPVQVITLESLRHWNLLKEVMAEAGYDAIRTIRIMPRLSSGAQFGMEKEEIRQIIKEQKDCPDVEVEGIHYFTGTQKKGKKYEKELEVAIGFVQELQVTYHLQNLILEYGPGFAVPYFNGDNFESPYGLIEQFREYISDRKPDCRIDVELGRYMAASCGKYITSVVDVKTADERNYCLVDGGIHQVNYYGSNMAMRTPVIRHIKCGNTGSDLSGSVVQDEKGEQQSKKEYMICGSLCTFADILARGVELEAPQIGDRLIFENIGAYSITEGSYLFLSHALPMVYLAKQSGEMELLREGIESWKINSADHQRSI